MSPLAKKLQIKPGTRWLFFNAPQNYLASLESLPDNVEACFEAKGAFDGTQLFVNNSTELSQDLKIIVPVLKHDAVFWITYPKKSSGIETDLGMMKDWDQLAEYGFTGVAAAAVNETWTALRFRPQEKSKSSDTCNDNIKQNEYSAYIDVDNRQVTLPTEIAEFLQKTPNALDFYQQLSYSNKKEYVLWILTAKQEKTREERLGKMVEKLSAGKKNPSEK